jgi:hypothetical protein
MGINLSKVKCMYFPAQSGKTQRVKENIQLFDCMECFGEEKNINFLISANNKLLVLQTSTRFQDVYSWISDDKKSYERLALDIINDNYNIVLMCSNRIRLNHLETLINELENCRHFTKKINIWIDEADSNINLWSTYSHVINKSIIEQVTLVSATFDPVFKKYSRLHVIGSDKPYPECYRSLKDFKIIETDFAGTPEEYITFIFEKYPKLIEPGKKAFIPGSFKTSSHDRIADMLRNNYNFAVLIINGSRKEILIPGKKSISLDSYFYVNDDSIPDEFKETMSRIYIENKLYQFPFAITGLECIKRGITFQTDSVKNDHPGFIFDYGIIPAISKKTEAYQLMARLFGNIGNFENYKQSEIYSTSTNFKKIEKQESMAMNIAKMVYERNLESVGPSELKEASVIKNYKVFDTQELGIAFAKTLGVSLKKRIDNQAPSDLLKNGINPSVADLVSRMWGLNSKTPVRMVPTNENKWCVYWKKIKN